MLNNDNDESRKMVEQCYKLEKTTLNPIIDWTDEDVWEFIHEYDVPYCKLYDEGWKRLGCVGCPMGTVAHRLEEFERWPKYKQAYIRAFDRMIEKRKQKNLKNLGWGHECNDDAEKMMELWTSHHNGLLDPSGGGIQIGESQEQNYTNLGCVEYSEASRIMEWWIK